MSESLRQFLERVLASNLLTRELVDTSRAGAANSMIASVPHLPDSIRDLLGWHDGFDLEVVRIHSVSDETRPIRTTSTGEIEFASDPAGFTYVLRDNGSVISVDHEGAEEKVVAQSVDDFLRGYVFGPRASEFSGEDWAREVSAALGTG